MKISIIILVVCMALVSCASSKYPCGDPSKWEAKTSYRNHR